MTRRIREPTALLVLSLTLGCGERRFFDAPPEIGYVAWVEIEGDERVVASSPLTPIAEAPVWAIDEDRSVYFVGFETSIIDPLLARSESAGWAAMPLTNAERCDVSIQLSWSTSLREGDSRVLPPLTAPWLRRACGAAGVVTPACAYCSGECELDVTEHTLAFDTGVPTTAVVGGLVRIDDRTLMTTLRSDVSADHVAVISLTEQGDPTNSVQLHDKITATIAYDGIAPYVGDELGRVIRLGADGSPGSLFETSPARPILVAAAPDAAVYAFHYGGSLFQVATSTATLKVEANLPIYDVAVDSEREVVLRYDEIRIYGSLLIQLRVPLPEVVRHEEFSIADRARVAIADGNILFAANGTPVYRLDGMEWTQLGWPPTDNQARAFVALDGGILIGGQEGPGPRAGLLYYQRSEQECMAAVFHGRINALVSSVDRKVAYAVTEGAGRPFLLEIRVK
jgi:hypothetical protein